MARNILFNIMARELGEALGDAAGEAAGKFAKEAISDHFDKKKSQRELETKEKEMEIESERRFQEQLANLPTVCPVCGAGVDKSSNETSCKYCGSNLLPEYSKIKAEQAPPIQQQPMYNPYYQQQPYMQQGGYPQQGYYQQNPVQSQPVQQPINTGVCPTCGNYAGEGVAMCGYCGTKLK